MVVAPEIPPKPGTAGSAERGGATERAIFGPFGPKGGMRSLLRRQAGESPAALSAAGRPHLPAVRAERGFPFDAFPLRGNRD